MNMGKNNHKICGIYLPKNNSDNEHIKERTKEQEI